MSELTPNPNAHLKFHFHTYGCKVNTYDTGLLEKKLKSHNKEWDLEILTDPLQIHILNTCAVTAEATQEAIREVRRIKKKSPRNVVVVTGCSAQVDTEKMLEQSEADLIVANSHKGQIYNIISSWLTDPNQPRLYKSNIFKKEDLEEGGGIETHHTRAFVKIQDGCNSFCTFCVIPFARGKSRSIEIESLIRRVNEIHAGGTQEVVLTGVHIGDYEFGLENLLEAVLSNTSIPRIRLTSLEPIEVSDRLLKKFENPRVCPHFHMSIQSATTSVLTNMKRKYSSEDVETSLQKIAKQVPQAFVGMDVIVGFPGETEEDFQTTYSRLHDWPWTKIHVFPYSERPGTYALRLPVANERSVIARRAEQLRTLSANRLLSCAMAQVGAVKKILVLSETRGLSRDYWNIKNMNENSIWPLNEEIEVRIGKVIEGAHPGQDPEIWSRLIDA